MERLVEAVNEAGARPGDAVLIAVAAGVVVRASLIVYALPVLGLLLVAAVAQGIAGVFAPAAADQVAGLGGAVGAVLGVLLARRLARRPGAALPAARVVRVTS